MGAALRLAQEAKNAAKEAEAVAMAKQYHAAHLSSELTLNEENSTAFIFPKRFAQIN